MSWRRSPTKCRDHHPVEADWMPWITSISDDVLEACNYEIVKAISDWGEHYGEMIVFQHGGTVCFADEVDERPEQQ
jgi:hypothetical protein